MGAVFLGKQAKRFARKVVGGRGRSSAAKNENARVRIGLGSFSICHIVEKYYTSLPAKREGRTLGG